MKKIQKKNIGLNTIYVRNKKRNINLYFNNNTNFYNVKDNKKKLIINNIETIKKDNNSTKEYRNIIYEKKHKENINTNKKYNNYNINQLFRTLRNFNVKKKSGYNSNTTKNKSNDNIFSDSDINEFDEVKNDENNDFIIISSIESRKSKNFFTSNNIIDIEVLYNLGSKILDIFAKTKQFQKFEDESLKLINYYFQNDISKLIVQLFNSAYYKNIIISYIKIELLTYFLCYDICNYNHFEQIILLIKSMINFIHNNFLLIIKYIFYKNENNLITFSDNPKNRGIILHLKNIINQSLSDEENEGEMSERNITKILMENTKAILNYYKTIIENVYQKDYISLNEDNENDNDLKFPYCFKYYNIDNSEAFEILREKMPFIISSFFIESYQLLNNFSIIDLEKFFYSFLDKTKFIASKNKEKQFILPKIDITKYKYTLVLDLDETLVHCNKENDCAYTLILRPGLIEFLQKMRNICELILFSFGSSSYVQSIVKEIEKDEKFFEFILDRSYGIYENGHCIKDLNMLNRNLKNMIIIDDTSNYFLLHKDNGICIKPFYGDIENEKNTLKVLARILEKIFNDANDTKDIRISLKKYKKILSLSNITNC